MRSPDQLRRLRVVIATSILAIVVLVPLLPQGTPEAAAQWWPTDRVDQRERASEPDHPVTVSFLDVGQADATLIQKGDIDILVDTGRHYSGELKAAMETITDSVDLMIITHPHADHYGGAAGILESYEVDRIVTNGERRGPPRDRSVPVTWEQFEEAVDEAGLELEAWEQGDEIDITPHMSIEVLASGGDFANTSSGTNINNDSLVMMVEYQDRRILLTGDIEIAGGKMLVSEHCDNGAQRCPALRADIFQVPHHGSHHYYPGFFEAADATWAVFGSPYDNRQHHHPRIETLQALVDQDARIKSTNKDGGKNVVATIDTDGDVSWNVDDPEIFVWRTDGDPEIPKTCRIHNGSHGTSAECERYGN